MAFPSEKGYAHSYLQLTTHSPEVGVFIFGNLLCFFVLSSAARSSTFCVISLLGCGVHQVPQLFPAFQEGVCIYKKLYSEPES